MFKTGIGQDSHRFLQDGSSKPCILAGVHFEDVPGFSADSDGDVVIHALCNAITSISHVPILGEIAVDLCHKDGITDSKVYLQKALETLQGQTIAHVAISIEGKRPRFQKRIDEMRQSIAQLLKLNVSQVGITATSGDGLTSFGCAEGVQCLCVMTVKENQ